MRKIILALCGKIIREEAEKINKDRGLKLFQEASANSKIGSRVYVVCEGPDNKFNEDLGISNERRAELDKIIENTVKKEKTFTMAIEVISRKCDNNQELAYICYRIGNLASDQAHIIRGQSMSNMPGMNQLPSDLAQLAMQPGTIEEKLDILAEKLGIPKEELYKAYQRFKRENGLND